MEPAIANGRLDRIANGLHRLRTALGLHEQSPAVTASEPEQGRRSEQLAATGKAIGYQLVDRIGGALDPTLVHAGDGDLDQMRERRIPQGPTPLDLLAEKTARV